MRGGSQLVWAFLFATSAGCHGIWDIETVGQATGDARVSSTGDSQVATCPSSFGTNRHLFFDADRSWQDANDHCIALDTDHDDSWFTHLAVPSDANEVGVLAQLNTDSVGFWLGYTDRKLNPSNVNGPPLAANFRWITAEDGYLAWGQDEPDDSDGSPYCGYQDTADQLIHDRSCARTIGYACECDQYPIVSENF